MVLKPLRQLTAFTQFAGQFDDSEGLTERRDEIGLLSRAFREQLACQHQLNAELLRMSTHDALTELPNRRLFDQRLTAAVSQATQEVAPLAVMMLDIDHFKLYNDGYGHQQGDECLKRVAAALQDVASRHGFFIARTGGEEFSALLPGVTSQHAKTLANALVDAVDQLHLRHERSPVCEHVTISVGIGMLDDSEASLPQRHHDDRRPSTLPCQSTRSPLCHPLRAVSSQLPNFEAKYAVMNELFVILITTALVNNFVLVQFLGLCPFMGVSNKLESALGMSLATTFVLTLASAASYVVYHGLLVPLDVTYLRTISFIVVIAAVVQFTEIMVRQLSPLLHQVLGIFLPLITTNCAVLGVALLSLNRELSFFHTTLYGLGAALGFSLVLVLFAAMRERLASADVPKPFRGAAIAMITASLMSLAFLGFSGLAQG